MSIRMAFLNGSILLVGIYKQESPFNRHPLKELPSQQALLNGEILLTGTFEQTCPPGKYL